MVHTIIVMGSTIDAGKYGHNVLFEVYSEFCVPDMGGSPSTFTVYMQGLQYVVVVPLYCIYTM